MYQFKEINRKRWVEYWGRVQFANLMQSWEYGEAKSCQGWKPLRFLVLDQGERPCGLLQVLFKGVIIVGGIARINRGPVMFNDPITEPMDSEQFYLLWSGIKKLSRSCRWWYVAIAPECPLDDQYYSLFKTLGYRQKAGRTAWGSTRLLLQSEEEDLLKGLNGKWRNLLRKGLKLGVEIIDVSSHQEYSRLVDLYASFQKQKKFVGVPALLLENLYIQSGSKFSFRVYKTQSENQEEISSFIFVVHHGDTATYLLAWSSDEGYQQQANYLLLWHAILLARSSGLNWFDMGGLTENTPQGIAHFKKGLNGAPYKLLGEF